VSAHFAPVRVNETLTLLFDDDVEALESHHYAFHVDDAELDAILQRVKTAGLSFGSAPWSTDDGELNDWNGGRGFYFKDRDGHILDLIPYRNESKAALGEAGAMESHKVVLRDEWVAARKALLTKEEELTRLRDKLSEKRRALPWVKVDKPYVFDTPEGNKTLPDLFDGRSQIIVQHFMFAPG
jgi:hypothetical protein